jgi:hypothetical protein
MEFVRKKAKLSRSQDTKRVVEAAIEGGHHLLAAIFHSFSSINMLFSERRKVGTHLSNRDGGLSVAIHPTSYGSSITI